MRMTEALHGSKAGAAGSAGVPSSAGATATSGGAGAACPNAARNSASTALTFSRVPESLAACGVRTTNSGSSAGAGGWTPSPMTESWKPAACSTALPAGKRTTAAATSALLSLRRRRRASKGLTSTPSTARTRNCATDTQSASKADGAARSKPSASLVALSGSRLPAGGRGRRAVVCSCSGTGCGVMPLLGAPPVSGVWLLSSASWGRVTGSRTASARSGKTTAGCEVSAPAPGGSITLMRSCSPAETPIPRRLVVASASGGTERRTTRHDAPARSAPAGK
mmetsp:Transcript_13699/g.52177  ORF Transcript_13699/g.52177 Transcript_13699/m.52177 type:complete len:281 (-) Transcript_13699:440-1282(-)